MGVRGIDKRTPETLERVSKIHDEIEEKEKLAWIIINGIKTDYLVSSHGIVYRCTKKNTIKYIRPYITKDGHLRLGLYYDDLYVKKYVHVLVAQAFIPNPENKPFIHHKDGDSLNNEYTNLQWVTKEEHDLLTHGLNQYKALTGSENPSSVYTDEQIRLALELMVENELYPDEICERSGISYSCFQKLRFRNESWSYIKKDYDISKYDKFRRQVYSNETKMDFIEIRRRSPELKLKEISKIMKIPYTNIKQWNRQYKYQIEA